MLLDTHTWLWHATGDAKRIGLRARREIDRATDRGALVVSVVSVLEVTALAATGRVRLALPAETWIRQSIDAGRIRVAEVTLVIALEAGSIPKVALPDPMDRLLVATARAWGIPIATRDAVMLHYVAAQGGLRAIDVSR